MTQKDTCTPAAQTGLSRSIAISVLAAFIAAICLLGLSNSAFAADADSAQKDNAATIDAAQNDGAAASDAHDGAAATSVADQGSSPVVQEPSEPAAGANAEPQNAVIVQEPADQGGAEVDTATDATSSPAQTGETAGESVNPVEQTGPEIEESQGPEAGSGDCAGQETDSEDGAVDLDPVPVALDSTPASTQTTAMAASAATPKAATTSTTPKAVSTTSSTAKSTKTTAAKTSAATVASAPKATTAKVTTTAKTTAATAAKPVAKATAKLPAKAVSRIISKVSVGNAVLYGKSAIPKIVVKAGTKVLRMGKDYSVVFKKNKKVGKATVTIVGKNGYKGKKKVAFRVYGKPKFTVGASRMPVNSKSIWTLKNAVVRLVKGKSVKTAGKNVYGIRSGDSKVAVYDMAGKRLKTQAIRVYELPDAVYVRVGSKNSLYLDMGTSKANGAKATAAKKNAKRSQQFRFEKAGSGNYRIKSVATGKYLQPMPGVKAENAPIIQWSKTSSSAQKWRLSVDRANNLTISNTRTGKVLSMSAKKPVAGTPVVQVSTKAKTPKTWDIAALAPKVVGASSMPAYSTTDWKLSRCTAIVTAGAKSLSLVKGHATAKAAGTATVSIYDQVGRLYTKKKVSVHALSGDYFINSSLDVGQVLDVDGWKTEDGGDIILWTSTGYVNQKYRFVYAGGGTYRIKSTYSGNLLRVAGKGAEDPNNIEQHHQSGSANERWRIVVDANELMTFVNAGTGKALDTKGGAKKRGTSIVQSRVTYAGSQKYRAVSLNEKIKANAKYNPIALYACRYAYSQPVYYQNNEANTGTKLYKKVCNAIWPDRDPMSCDRGVGAAVRWSGSDIDIPPACSSQYKYLKKSSNWENLGKWSGNEKDLKPGDILIRTTKTAPGTSYNHVCVYVGQTLAMAAYNTYIKGTDGDKGTPTTASTFVSAHKSAGNKKKAAAACIGNAKYAHADSRMMVFRLKTNQNSLKYSALG